MSTPVYSAAGDTRYRRKYIVAALVLLLCAAAAFLFFVPATSVDYGPPGGACQVNISQCYKYCVRYCEEHERRLPLRLEDLKPYMSQPEFEALTVCPNKKDGQVVRYELLQPGKKITSFDSTASTILLQETTPNHRQGKARVICFVDGHTELIREKPAP